MKIIKKLIKSFFALFGISVVRIQKPMLVQDACKKPTILHPSLKLSVENPNISIQKALDEIPSETTANERRYLYKFFSHIWSGRGHVIEIGPFLGGTSRAIALGMQANPARCADSKLYTYDRFSNYYDAKALKEFLSPLLASGLISEKKLENLGDHAEFLEVFKTIHAKKDYSEIFSPIDQCVPDCREQLNKGGKFIDFANGISSDAIFIDGCKSWFGTKYFMAKALEISRPGTWFLFQDFGWYTCFWLSSFMYFFKDSFEFFCNVDATYTFRLKTTIPKEQVEKMFPDIPDDITAEKFKQIFDYFVSNSLERGDFFGATMHTIHLAGALAYIGEKTAARKILLNLKEESWSGCNPYIDAALISPTYKQYGETWEKVYL